MSARALRGKGYRVTEVRTGLAALAILEGEDERFDLLVTDVVMPELDGPALIQQARQVCPEIPVICVSGYAESTFRRKLSHIENLHFLAKPFSLQQLAGIVKDVVAGPPCISSF